MLVGFVDLVATAVLHSRGLIVELNPLMRVFLDRSEWAFVLVKGGTLLLAWGVMVSHARVNVAFVRKAAISGTIAYVALWSAWFAVSSLTA